MGCHGFSSVLPDGIALFVVGQGNFTMMARNVEIKFILFRHFQVVTITDRINNVVTAIFAVRLNEIAFV